MLSSKKESSLPQENINLFHIEAILKQNKKIEEKKETHSNIHSIFKETQVEKFIKTSSKPISRPIQVPNTKQKFIKLDIELSPDIESKSRYSKNKRRDLNKSVCYMDNQAQTPIILRESIYNNTPFLLAEDSSLFALEESKPKSRLELYSCCLNDAKKKGLRALRSPEEMLRTAKANFKPKEFKKLFPKIKEYQPNMLSTRSRSPRVNKSSRGFSPRPIDIVMNYV